MLHQVLKHVRGKIYEIVKIKLKDVFFVYIYFYCYHYHTSAPQQRVEMIRNWTFIV